MAGVGVVRAFDITADPVLDLPTVFERIRAAAAAGPLPQVIGGGYAILNGRITAAGLVGLADLQGRRPARVPRARVGVHRPGPVRLHRPLGRVQK